MLSELSVSNIALIEDASITFQPGLTVLSGETGAGKTALLSALKLLMGERADSSSIRDGASSAVVEGTFTSPSASFVVRRRLSSDGRSRCWIDGKTATVAELALKVGPLVDLHGQHEHQDLLTPATHERYLDEWIGAAARTANENYRTAFAAASAAERALDELEAARRRGEHALEDARFTIREIEAVHPYEGEYEELQRSLPALQHAQDLAQAADGAWASLDDEDGAVSRIGSARAVLERIGGIDDELDCLAERLSDVLAETDDIAASLRAYRDSVEFDPRVLEQHLDRLGTLDGLCKRFGPRMEDVFIRLEEARRTVELVDTSDEAFERAHRDVEQTEERLNEAASVLGALRYDAADGFSAALSSAIEEIGMSGATIVAVVSDLPRQVWTAEGCQHVEFLYAPAPAVAPRPLARIASGGEISRVMLALKGSIVHHEMFSTLVFDEIDTGIGGATAKLIADRLLALSENCQVIVVTHLAQIAAAADHQLLVTKDSSDIPHTTLEPLAGEARVAEIARMLAGTTDDLSLAHARELLRDRVGA